MYKTMRGFRNKGSGIVSVIRLYAVVGDTELGDDISP